MGNVKVKISYESAAAWFFITWFSGGLIRIVCRRLLGLAGLSEFYILAADTVIYIPLILTLIFRIKAKKMPGSILRFATLYTVAAVLFTVTLAVHPDYLQYYTRHTYGVWDSVFRPDNGALWACLAVFCSENSKVLKRNMKLAAILLFFYSTYQFMGAGSRGYWQILDYQGRTAAQSYNLGFGYSVMFCALIFFSLFLKEHRIWQGILGICSFIMALVGGSRGCLLVFLIFVILYTIKELTTVTLKKKILILLAALSGYILIQFSLDHISSVLSGLNLRTVEMLVNGSIAEDNGRDAIYQLAREAIAHVPLLGYGTFGDRQFIAPYYYWGYSHNLFLELIIDFGRILGLAIFVFLIWKCVQALLKAEGDQSSILCILISVNVKLFLSDTFWGYPQFWMLVVYVFFIFPREQGQTRRFIRSTGIKIVKKRGVNRI